MDMLRSGQRSPPTEDYMNPIIADADTGHGGLTATMKLAKMFIENGAAGIHIEELLWVACGIRCSGVQDSSPPLPPGPYENPSMNCSLGWPGTRSAQSSLHQELSGLNDSRP